MKKFNEKFNETLDTLGEIGYWLGVRFERYIEENKDDILELLGILGAFFVMWWITSLDKGTQPFVVCDG